MSTYSAISLMIYASWQSINIYHSYVTNKKITRGNAFSIAWALLLSYLLIKPSVLFLFAKLFDGIFALGLGFYVNLISIPTELLNQRDKVINGYWGYTIVDLAICLLCFVISILGSIYG